MKADLHWGEASGWRLVVMAAVAAAVMAAAVAALMRAALAALMRAVLAALMLAVLAALMLAVLAALMLASLAALMLASLSCARRLRSCRRLSRLLRSRLRAWLQMSRRLPLQWYIYRSKLPRLRRRLRNLLPMGPVPGPLDICLLLADVCLARLARSPQVSRNRRLVSRSRSEITGLQPLAKPGTLFSEHFKDVEPAIKQRSEQQCSDDRAKNFFVDAGAASTSEQAIADYTLSTLCCLIFGSHVNIHS